MEDVRVATEDDLPELVRLAELARGELGGGSGHCSHYQGSSCAASAAASAGVAPSRAQT